jgi:hypothetical protein
MVPSAAEQGTLEAWARATSIERRRVERARIVLLAAAAWPGGRSCASLADGIIPSANGGCGSPESASPGSPMRRVRANRRPTTPRPTGVSRSAGPRARARGRREAGHPGARACPGLSQAAQWPRAYRVRPRVGRRGTTTLFAALNVATGQPKPSTPNAAGAPSSLTGLHERGGPSPLWMSKPS